MPFSRSPPDEGLKAKDAAAQTVAAESLGALSGSAVVYSGREVLAGRYRLLGLLGTGGMGTVYRALDLELDETVALKVLKHELVSSPEALARFRQEAKLARRVTHRNVARTFDIGEHAGEKFLTMEYVEGESLALAMARTGPFAFARAAEVVAEICDGLAAAHAVEVVHRDLKPDNVLCGAGGRVVITDFGIARACGDTARHTIGLVGTPEYMAPEQVEGLAVDERADIYALGVLTFELLTGERPWTADGVIATATARLLRPPPDPRTLRPDIPTAFAELVLSMMARRPEDRPAGAAAVASRVRSLGLEASSFEVRITERPPRPRLEASTQPGEKTVAVLPFKNMGPPEDAYVAEGLVEDLVDTLSRTSGLRVRTRRATTTSIEAKDAAPELDVQVVVEGSVRRHGETWRLSARVVSVADGFVLWSSRFDRPTVELLAVSDEIASSVSRALLGNAGEPSASGAQKPTPPVPERHAPLPPAALDAYLRGRAALARGWVSADTTREAAALFARALESAPDDPALLAGFAMAQARLVFTARDETALPRAKTAADRAVSGAPERGDSWLALALVHRYSGETPLAMAALQRALAVAPSLAMAHLEAGRYLLEAGAFDDARAHLEASLSLDPTIWEAKIELTRLCALLGDWSWAKIMAETISPTTAGEFLRTRLVSRLTVWRQVVGLPPFDARLPQAPLAGQTVATDALFAATLQGKLNESVIGDLEEQLARMRGVRLERTMLQLYAECLSATGDRAGAVTAVARAVDAGLEDLGWLRHAPPCAALRADPRWTELEARVVARAQPTLDAWYRRDS